MNVEEVKAKIAAANATSENLNKERQINIGKRESYTIQLDKAFADYEKAYGVKLTKENITQELERVRVEKEKELALVEGMIACIQMGDYNGARQLAGEAPIETVEETTVNAEVLTPPTDANVDSIPTPIENVMPAPIVEEITEETKPTKRRGRPKKNAEATPIESAETEVTPTVPTPVAPTVESAPVPPVAPVPTPTVSAPVPPVAPVPAPTVSAPVPPVAPVPTPTVESAPVPPVAPVPTPTVSAPVPPIAPVPTPTVSAPVPPVAPVPAPTVSAPVPPIPTPTISAPVPPVAPVPVPTTSVPPVSTPSAMDNANAELMNGALAGFQGPTAFQEILGAPFNAQ